MTASQASGDLRTSDGEVVLRADLEFAAGLRGRYPEGDARLAGYEGIPLARAALAGDRVALDDFHRRCGLALPGVAEHGEGYRVRLAVLPESDGRQDGPILTFRALNEGGHNATYIDAAQLVAWILSPEGRAALARRGIAAWLWRFSDRRAEFFSRRLSKISSHGPRRAHGTLHAGDNDPEFEGCLAGDSFGCSRSVVRRKHRDGRISDLPAF